MLKILQIMAGGANGGAENAFKLTLNAFKDHLGQELSQIAITRTNKRNETLRNRHQYFYEAKFGGPVDIYTSWYIHKLIRTTRPQFVLTWMKRALFHCPSNIIRRILPKYCHIARFDGYYNTKYYQKCDAMIAITPHLKAWVEENLRDSRPVYLIPNFTTMPQQEEQKQVFTTNGPLKIVALGRLHISKAFDILVKAIYTLKHLDISLTIAGEGPEKKALLQLIDRLNLSNKIVLVPWRDNVSSLYKEGDLFVCPSRQESFGLVLIEAMAHKIPVISSETYGGNFIIDNKVSGLLFPVDCVEALADSIETLYNDESLRRRLAENAFEKFKNNFTAEIITKKYFQMFQSLS